MRIRVKAIDYGANELCAQVPFEANLIREMPGPDRADYWLAETFEPLKWKKGGRDSRVKLIILATRAVGDEFGPGMKDVGAGIAYVTDESLLDDETLSLLKCEYVGVGVVDAVDPMS